MSDQFLSYEPQAGLKPEATKPDASQAGYWEDRGVGGKVWHPPAVSGNERTREDNSLLGLPPELAVVSALGVGRAVAGAGIGAGARAAAGAKALAGQAAPLVKYEIYRQGLMHMGVPWYVADGIAAAAAGYKRGAGRAAAGEAAAGEAAASEAAVGSAPLAPPTTDGRVGVGQLTKEQLAERMTATRGNPFPTPVKNPRPVPTVTERAPVETAPASAARPVAEADPLAASAPQGNRSPAQIANDEALARRRAEYSARQMSKMTQEGAARAEATPEPSAGPKPKMTNDQAKRYLDLRGQNKTHAQARAIVEAESKLAGGLPTDVQAKAAVNERNATGDWPEGWNGQAPVEAPPAAKAAEASKKSVSPLEPAHPRDGETFEQWTKRMKVPGTTGLKRLFEKLTAKP